MKLEALQVAPPTGGVQVEESALPKEKLCL